MTVTVHFLMRPKPLCHHHMLAARITRAPSPLQAVAEHVADAVGFGGPFLGLSEEFADSLFVLDGHGQILVANGQFAELFGTISDES